MAPIACPLNRLDPLVQAIKDAATNGSHCTNPHTQVCFSSVAINPRVRFLSSVFLSSNLEQNGRSFLSQAADITAAPEGKASSQPSQDYNGIQNDPFPFGRPSVGRFRESGEECYTNIYQKVLFRICEILINQCATK